MARFSCIWYSLFIVFASSIEALKGRQAECTGNTGVACGYDPQKGCASQGCCQDSGGSPQCYIPAGSPDGPGGQCSTEDAAKLDCGSSSTGQSECLVLGCCWKPLPSGNPYPWCFQADGTVTAEYTGTPTTTVTTTTISTNASATTRPSVGGYCDVVELFPCNTGDNPCESMGCCWDTSAPLHCYHSDAPPEGPDGAQCVQEIEQKVDCGVLGTTKDECINVFGCCWQTQPESTVYDPWCYQPLPAKEFVETSNLCDNTSCVHGDCVIVNGGRNFACKCHNGYKGRYCEIAKKNAKLPHH